MVLDHPDWISPSTLEALPGSVTFLEGEENVSVGNTEGNRDGTAVPTGYRRVVTNVAVADADGARKFMVILVRGSTTRKIWGAKATEADLVMSQQLYIILDAADYIRIRHYVGTAADRVSWSVFGWDVPV